MKVSLALVVLGCAAEPGPPAPDLGSAMDQLNRIERWVEERADEPCAVPMRVEVRADCYYPHRIPVVEIVRRENGR